MAQGVYANIGYWVYFVGVGDGVTKTYVMSFTQVPQVAHEGSGGGVDPTWPHSWPIGTQSLCNQLAHYHDER